MPDGDVDKAVSTTINQRFATTGKGVLPQKDFYSEDVYEEFDKLVESASVKVVILLKMILSSVQLFHHISRYC